MTKSVVVIVVLFSSPTTKRAIWDRNRAFLEFSTGNLSATVAEDPQVQVRKYAKAISQNVLLDEIKEFLGEEHAEQFTVQVESERSSFLKNIENLYFWI